MFEEFIEFVQELYQTKGPIPLHEPQFIGNERKYVLEAIDSTYVSSVGKCVQEFEERIAEYTGNKFAIATVNGTAALHMALKLAGVKEKDQVITQSLGFVATTNAIYYCNAEPIFLDVKKESLSLCPEQLNDFLVSNCEVRDDGVCWNKKDNRPVRACLPMHTFGFPAEVDRLKRICDEYKLELVEDAAESLGSFFNNQHTGSVGLLSILSFNGNKIITTGGGGMVLTNEEDLALKAKHLTTTAKVLKDWSWEHDQIGFNYRLPNINAALGMGQMEMLDQFVDSKRSIANSYCKWFQGNSINFFEERPGSKANYWLNTIITEDRETRDCFLKETNASCVNTRAVWAPMHTLDFNKKRITSDLKNTMWLCERLVNLPSSPILEN